MLSCLMSLESGSSQSCVETRAKSWTLSNMGWCLVRVGPSDVVKTQQTSGFFVNISQKAWHLGYINLTIIWLSDIWLRLSVIDEVRVQLLTSARDVRVHLCLLNFTLMMNEFSVTTFFYNLNQACGILYPWNQRTELQTAFLKSNLIYDYNLARFVIMKDVFIY